MAADGAGESGRRAHTGLLDHVQVDYYGSMVPISQVA
ncbi:ribosome recycling factor, partial [Ralstonia pseudosolanacearum]